MEKLKPKNGDLTPEKQINITMLNFNMSFDYAFRG